MPQLDFKFLRDTPNYRMYIAEDPEGSGVPYHLYLPSHVLTNVATFTGIVSRHRSGAPGVFDDGTVKHEPSPLVVGESVHRHYEKLLRHAENYRAPKDFLHFDLPRAEREFVFGGTQTGRFASVSDHEQIRRLTQRIFKLEQRQSILFKAIEKILLRLRWIKPKPKKYTIDIETNIAPIVVSVADDKDRVELFDFKTVKR